MKTLSNGMDNELIFECAKVTIILAHRGDLITVGVKVESAKPCYGIIPTLPRPSTASMWCVWRCWIVNRVLAQMRDFLRK